MTAMAQNSELMLFITHVETDGPLLKIWGQIDRNAATCVERMILPLSEKFTQGLGVPNPNFPLPMNAICCARFQNDGYYRAKIINIQPNGNILVHFIDYGNFEVLPPSAIRLLDKIPSTVPLQALPPLALDFILAHILPVNGTWDTETIESIKQSLRYADLKGILHSIIGSHRLLKLCYNNADFGELLVSKNLAVNVSLQDMFLRRPPPPQNRMQQFPGRENVPTASGYLSRSQPNQNSVPPQEDWRSSQHRQPPSYVPAALEFKSRVLDVGSVHDVYVSYVEDGPLKFAVQVQSTSETLKKLMHEINQHPTAPLQEPPLPGSVCLGRDSHEKVLCRAVVMAVMEQKCKVYYVDFGHTEVLPYSDIFQLQPQYINPKVFSIRFTLSGLKDMIITDATKDYFKKIVTGKPLVLQVKPPEGPPLIQYGDLYDNRTNVKDLLKKTCDVTAPIFYQEPHRLKPGFKNLVHISFVESCTKFFIQLDSEVESLNPMMIDLAEYAKVAPPLEEKCLQVGWPCCAFYSEDKQWYRAQILSIKGDQVTVLYVDYGNEEIVRPSSLRKIHNGFVTNLRAQAIKCILNGFQSSIFNQELANQFELMVLEKKLLIEVVDTLHNSSVVELFDCSVVPMVSISSKLQFAASPANRGSNLNSSNHSYKAAEQVLNSSKNSDQKYHSEEGNSKWGKNSKPNTWAQEARSNEWGGRPRNYNHEDREHSEDKSRPKNAKDVENEQRRKETNRHDGEDRLHPKETRNNYFNRPDSAATRFDRSEENGSRRGRGNRFGSREFDKNMSKDDSWSDRDSDTSSRSSGKRGSKGPRGIKGRADRGGRRGGDRKPTSGKWSDGDSDRSSQKSTPSSGFRLKDRNSATPTSKNSKAQPSRNGNWNSMSPTSPVKETPRVQKPRIPPPNITVGAVKNVEVIYTDSPTDFYVQLCPDNLELHNVMEKIAQKYGSGGTSMRSTDVQQGTCCIAQYSCDSKWYRAIIKTKNVDSATVHFIDYGNTETVGFDKIKELQPEFAKLSTQAVHCKLFAAVKSSWTDAEIDEFSQMAEGISLEAEFLAQENGVYEVLLKPIEDGSSASVEHTYLNTKFCGNTDLMQAKKNVRTKTKGTLKKARDIPEYIPNGQKWGNESFDSGFQIDVVVTWFVNPNNFYCQILSKQSEFRHMMNEIQESYGEQQPIKNALQVGAPVIAFFSDDGALYRAEIKELNKLRGHIVQYVDFGNCAMVDPSKIYPVEKRFALLSKQAMHCSLKNVLPAAGIDWSKANKHEIDKYFDADKYKCTFHGTKDGKYIISLSNNGKDIGESMIAAGLATNPETSVKTVVHKVTDTSAQPNSVRKVTENQDLTIWSGQTIRSSISNVQGAAKFFIQLPQSEQSTTAERVECYLFDIIPSTKIDGMLKKSIEGKDAIVGIKNVNNQRFAVELYDVLGKKVKLVETDSEDNVCPICPLPLSNLVENVWVSHIDSAQSIWLQRSSDVDNIAELLSSLYEYYSVSGTVLVPEKGKLCVAESADTNWYRAIIKNVTDNEAEVQFIDYGNSEKISFTGIKVLEEKFHTPHQLAVCVSLIVNLKGSEEEQKSILQKNLDDKEVTATFYNMSNNWLVDLQEGDKKISELLTELNLVTGLKDTQPAQMEIREMIVGNRYEVFLSHSDSPAQFWLQRNEEIDAIELMQANLQAAAPNFSSTTGIPEEGTLCAALYSADGNWYRAEVLDADEDITTVRFIDYGNTDVIDSNSDSIKELPQSLKRIKKYGLKSRLDLIPTGSEDWSTASCEMFENMATATNSPITALIIADSVPRRVELFVGENSIGDALVKEGHAIEVHNAEDLIDEIIDLELDPRSAFVSHVNSPSEFWVQEEKSVSDLEIMTDRFIVAEMFPKLEDITEGTLCVAKFPDDEQWYRARVNSHTASGTQVLYIDYGNSAVSTEVRIIPEDLAAIPPLSRKCSLQFPPGVKEWSEEACDKFIDLAADGATIFLLDVIKDGETSIVGLTLEGNNVADELAQLCNVLPVIDERLPPLGEENSPNVVVSHVNSPSEFWTQAESSITELEIMASRLVDADSLLPLNTFEKGTICAAQFPEDGQWYRAKILSHGESGTNTIYYDYGNSALTTELRILPEDVANIPSLATRCKLSLPEDVESWSEEACVKFNDLVADGVTMFQFEILDDNDPTLISLQLDGKDVVDILKPLCKAKVSPQETDKETTEPQEVETKIVKIISQNEENVKINGMTQAEAIQTENLNDSKVEEIQTSGSKHNGEITEIETEKSLAKEIEVIHLDSDCETETATTEDINTSEDQIKVSDTNSKTDKASTDNINTPEAETHVPDTNDKSEKAKTDEVNIPEPETEVPDTNSKGEKAQTDEVNIPEPEMEVPDTNSKGEKAQTDEVNIPEPETEVPDTNSKGEKAQTDEVNIPEPEMEVPGTNSKGEKAQTDEVNIYEIETQVPDTNDKNEKAKTDVVNIPEVQMKVPNTNSAGIISEELVIERQTMATESSNSLDVTLKTEVPEPESNDCDEVTEMKIEMLIEDSDVSTANDTVTMADDVKKEVDAAVELTVDEIVGNMVKVALEGMDSENVTVEELMTNQTEITAEVTAAASKDTAISTSEKTPATDKIVPGSISRGSMEEDIPLYVLGRRRSSCSEDRIVPGGINKGNDLTEAEIVELLPAENSASIVPPPNNMEHKDEPVPSTPGKIKAEEKIVPGSISRGESPTTELSRPITPKTPHSEKLLAGVVNLQENLPECEIDEENDEILIIEAENNIPQYKST